MWVEATVGSAWRVVCISHGLAASRDGRRANLAAAPGLTPRLPVLELPRR